MQRNKKGIGVAGAPANNAIGNGESVTLAFAPQVRVTGLEMWFRRGGLYDHFALATESGPVDYTPDNPGTIDEDQNFTVVDAPASTYLIITGGLHNALRVKSVTVEIAE